MEFKFGDLETTLRLLQIKGKADEAIDGAFESAAPRLEREAKLNAPWRDRTGNARRTLHCGCDCKPLAKKHLAVVGKMHYSPRLELDYGGRYSILFPTVLRNARDVLHSVVEAVEGVRV